jgi:hypothetical protein
MLQVFPLFQTRMLQVFYLDVAKVDLDVATIAAAGPACMRVGVEGAPWCGRGTWSDAGPHVKQARQAWASGR